VGEAESLGVGRVFTFAAMATPMRPAQHSRVFGAAIDPATLEEFRQLDMVILGGGQISGLNGVLLGVAAAEGLPGGCLLGEMPQIFPHIPFPKAAQAVLEFFSTMAGIEIDLRELREHGKTVEKTLEDFLVRMEQAAGETQEAPDEPASTATPAESLKPADRTHLETLFEAAAKDRSRAYELKQELDRLGIFGDFEDRFLDLFKDPD
ncbi:MAG TPA: PAC2 family protein, partial [Luteolibacter sp.]|nr:PAC2 family protein [Luteolibacter sp.]